MKSIKVFALFISLTVPSMFAAVATGEEPVDRSEPLNLEEAPSGNIVTPSGLGVASPHPIQLYEPPTDDYEEEVVPDGGFERTDLLDELKKETPAVLKDPNVIPRFKKNYSRKKRPRIALFLNRELSDSVVKWSSGRVGEDPHADGRSDEKAGKRWNWAFEDELINKFVRVGTRTVDRSTIVRLMGTQTPEMLKTTTRHEYDGQYYNQGMNVKNIEMNALKGYADLFVEILITKQPTLKDYEFKAKVIEVKTGEIKAHTTSFGKLLLPKVGRTTVASSSGYKEYIVIKIPTPQDVANWLSLELMDGLSTSWEME
jgi:hypothetical protein